MIEALNLQPKSAARTRANGLAWLMALAAVWLWTWRHLSIEWRANEQYQYGFAVPVLAVYLAVQRLRESGCPPRSISSSFRYRFGFFGLGLAAWLFFLLGELVRQQDPAWRLGGGLMMFSATLLTVYWLLRQGGMALVRRLAFPLAFAWLAVPWPSEMALWVTGNMLRLLTGAAVDLLNWTGTPALQRGNIIELSNGIVGMETACSGVQSLQASLMAALFLGEFFRLTFPRRLAVVLGGCALALAGNLVRIVILTRVVHLYGQNALDHFHDPVGSAVTAITFGGILILAWLVARKSPQTRPVRAVSNERLLSLDLPGVDGYLVFAALALAPVIGWTWFAAITRGASDTATAPFWKLQTNNLAQGWSVARDEILPAERRILRFTDGQSLNLRSPDGQSAQVFHFYWQPKDRMASTVFAHTPDICMRSAGWEPADHPLAVQFKIRGMHVQGALFRFRQDTVEQIVFQAILPQPFFGNVYPALDRKKHFALLWNAPRQRIHEEILVYVLSRGNRDDQLRASRQFLEQVLWPNTQP